MKKLLFLGVIFAMILFAGCGNSKNEDKTDSGEAASDEDAADTEQTDDSEPSDNSDSQSVDGDADTDTVLEQPDDADSTDDCDTEDELTEEDCLAREGFAWIEAGKACLPKVAGRICTGQTTCFSNENKISCLPSDNAGFYGQDALYAAMGKCIPQSFDLETLDGIEIIKDLNSGLVWKMLFSTEKYNYAEAEIYCGEGWRIPTLKEFLTMMNDRVLSPALDGYFIEYLLFSQISQSLLESDNDDFWTSTPFAGDDDFVILVDPIYRKFNDLGNTSSEVAKNYVLCVGGNTLPAADLTKKNENGDIVYVDSTTELMWQGNVDSTERSWNKALQYCEKLDYAGFTDWRMPNRNELVSIISNEKTDSPFSYIPSSALKDNYWWTSTVVPQYKEDVYGNTLGLPDIYLMTVDFATGEVSVEDHSSNKSVICVR